MTAEEFIYGSMSASPHRVGKLLKWMCCSRMACKRPRVRVSSVPPWPRLDLPDLMDFWGCKQDLAVHMLPVDRGEFDYVSRNSLNSATPDHERSRL